MSQKLNWTILGDFDDEFEFEEFKNNYQSSFAERRTHHAKCINCDRKSHYMTVTDCYCIINLAILDKKNVQENIE